MNVEGFVVQIKLALPCESLLESKVEKVSQIYDKKVHIKIIIYFCTKKLDKLIKDLIFGIIVGMQFILLNELTNQS